MEKQQTVQIVKWKKNGLGQRNIKGATNDGFTFHSWFASKRPDEAAMDVGADIIGMVKTNKKGFCMDTIEKITKYLPIGSYFVLKRMSIVPRYRPLLDIGYKNNSQKVLYFILTDDVWSANSGIPYLSK